MELGASKQLVDSYVDDELDHAGKQRLRAWLEENPANVKSFVREIYLHQQLREALAADNFAHTVVPVMESDEANPARPISSWSSMTSLLGHSSLPTFALIIGIVVGSITTWRIASRNAANVSMLSEDRIHSQASPASGSKTLATLVSATNCRWDTARSTANLQRGSALQPGESLHLLEGIAEISVSSRGGPTTLQLEGPLALTLTSEGMPSLLYGKVTGFFSSDVDQFALDTPLGRVIASGHASLGVIAAANDVELHVFSGSATLQVWTIGLEQASDPISSMAGESLHASISAGGKVKVDRGQSRESWFVTPAAVAESQLKISDEYVRAVLKAEPIAYWRFQNCVNGVFHNEMSDRLHCRMVGNAVRWRSNQDDGTVEFGTAAGPGYLISDDRLDGAVKDRYTLEAWVKPMYYHHGTLFSLIEWTPSQSPLGSHRMALEVCGPVSGFTVPYRSTDATPGRIRFIHECRRNFDAECFSPAPYAVRKWQHIVAAKDPSRMSLYVDGQLVNTEEADGALAPDLRVLMGQLLPMNPEVKDEVTSRLFGGELDEVALYDRTLSAEEIHKHVALAAPEPAAKEEASSDAFK
jgi:hypothetical protein